MGNISAEKIRIPEELAEKLDGLIDECVRIVMSDGSLFLKREDAPELYELAKSVAFERKTVSAYYLQRRLGISYDSARSLISRLEADGIVSPTDGTRARTVIGN